MPWLTSMQGSPFLGAGEKVFPPSIPTKTPLRALLWVGGAKDLNKISQK